MKLTRLEPSQSKRGGWVLTASNQSEIRKLLVSLAEDEYRVANRRAQSYWLTDQALMRVKMHFTNWRDFPALQSVQATARPSSPPRPTTTPRHQHQLALSPASAQTLAPAPLVSSNVKLK